MNKFKKAVLGLALGVSLAGSANAVPAYWTDWTSILTASPGVAGSLAVGADTVGVTFTGAYNFAQTSGGTNYWNPSAPYMSAVVDNAPPAADIIALSSGGTATISFSQAVTDPLIALVSWNSNTVDFNTPIEILSYGAGYWGGGTPVLNADGDGFFGSGEVHGVIRLPGTFTSISFTHTSETWHGLTVGVLGVADPGGGNVPEPISLVLTGIGLVALAAARRRRS